MNVTERVAYLRGLLEGMELDTDKKEGKVWKAVRLCFGGVRGKHNRLGTAECRAFGRA